MRRGKILRNLWADYSWFIIILLGTISLVLGYIGFWKNGQYIGSGRTILDNLYLTLGLISLNSGAVPPPISWELQIARFLVPAITAFTAFLAFTTLFIQQTDQVRLWFLQDHVIICGLGRKGFRLANQFLQGGTSVVVIEVDEGNDWIGNIRSAGAIVMNGDAGDPELLEKVKLNRAACLISVVGDDGKNAEVAIQAEKISSHRKEGCLTCVIHIFDSQLWGLLREKELNTNQNTRFRLQLFNIFDRGARLMLQENPPWIKETDNHQTHILVVGLGKMGQRLVVEAARGWRMHQAAPGEKLHISIIDLNAERKLEALQINYPRLNDLCAFNPVNMNILSGDFDKTGPQYIKEKTALLAVIYICLDDETLSLQAGLRLNHALRQHSIPIVLRMVESGGLALLLDKDQENQDSFGNLKIFDLLDQTCTAELLQKGTHEILARNLHAVYLEGCKLAGADQQSGEALVPWNELSEYLKEKNRRQADRIPLMLASAGFRITPLRDWDVENLKFNENGGSQDDEITLMAKLEHVHWCQEKTAEGWKYGPEKNPAQKTNPSILPWDELPEGEQGKNKKYIRGLPRLLARAGFQIEKH